MIHLPSKQTELLARPHFEAVITDLASMYKMEALDLRNRIKKELIRAERIKKSTTELSENGLKQIANQLSSFYLNQREVPSKLDLRLILKTPTMSDQTQIPDANQPTLFPEIISTLQDKQTGIKKLKGFIRDIETDYPMELEDLMLQLKDLKKQVEERKREWLKHLSENNEEYMESRERLQQFKEEEAHARLDLYNAATGQAREGKDLDQTVIVEGAPFRLQTEKGLSVYLNGKVIK